MNIPFLFPGFNDAGEYWRSDYEVDDFGEQLELLWERLRPLYQQLHAYVRARLVERYGETVVPRNGPIPAHLLGTYLEGSERVLRDRDVCVCVIWLGLNIAFIS